VELAWRDLPDKVAYDVHVHALGDNEKESGAFINPGSKTIRKITHYLRYRAYLSAGNVKDKKRVDQEYITHLVKLARHGGHPIRLFLLAFDQYYDRAGHAVSAKTEFYIPNAWVMTLSQIYPDVFVPVISVHPYRKDAIADLEKWAGLGVRMVKWIPNVQGINPADEAIVPFYEAMKRLGMVLLTHAGEEVLGTPGLAWGIPLIAKPA
jgi:predicted TIM-barrel fold metal-dependent hydrolase